jgi:uncharacterized protein (DUF1697 family)
MTRWVLLLRGINVGGGNRIPMRDLVALLEGLGLRDARTSIQSGNAAFLAEDGADPGALAAAITGAIRESHGFAPRALLLPGAAVRAAIEANPFPEATAQPTTLHVCFLAAEPVAPDLDALDALRGPRERFALDGVVLYLHLPDGLGRSKLAERLERHLGVQATVRNWNTVLRLAMLADEPG